MSNTAESIQRALRVFGALRFDAPAAAAVAHADAVTLAKLIQDGHLLESTMADGTVVTYRATVAPKTPFVDEAVLRAYREHYIARLGTAVQQYNTKDVREALQFVDVARPHLERVFELPLPPTLVPTLFVAIGQGYRLLHANWTEAQLEGLYAQIAQVANTPEGKALPDSQLILAWATLHIDPDAALQILAKLPQDDRAKLLRANALHWKGRRLSDRNEHVQALAAYEETHKIREQVLGSNHPDTAAVESSIGTVYLRMGKHADAVEHMKKALDIRLSTLGDAHVEVASSYNNIGLALRNLGMFARALDAHQSALKIRQQSLGERHIDTAKSHGNIANVYFATKDYAKALEGYQKELRLLTDIVGENHVDVAATCSNIGDVYKKVKDYEAALEMHKKALAIRQKVLGDKHMDTAVSYNHVGLIYEQLDEHQKAIEYLMKDLNISKELLGEDNMETGKSYNGIATVYEAMGETNKALDLYHKYLVILESTAAGKDSGDVAALLYNIAQLYHSIDETTKAKELMTRARDIWRRLGNKTDADDADDELDEWS